MAWEKPINIGTYRPLTAKIIRWLLRGKQCVVVFRGRRPKKDWKHSKFVQSIPLQHAERYSIYLRHKTQNDRSVVSYTQQQKATP